MDLKTQSEFISCQHITFLDKKYRLYNELEFNKKMVSNSKDFTRKIHLSPVYNFRYISKKDCIYQSTEPYQGIFENQFQEPKFNTNVPLFNFNTKAKFNQETICP